MYTRNSEVQREDKEERGRKREERKMKRENVFSLSGVESNRRENEWRA